MNKTKITDLRPQVATLTWEEEKGLYEKNTMVIDYGNKPLRSEKISQFKFEFDSPDDIIGTTSASCGCTLPKIKLVDEKTQILDVTYDTSIKGNFSKQITLYNKKDKTKKQLIKLTGTIG